MVPDFGLRKGQRSGVECGDSHVYRVGSWPLLTTPHPTAIPPSASAVIKLSKGRMCLVSLPWPQEL